MKRRRGFTLVEILTVVAVLILLAGLVLGTYRLAIKQGRFAEATSNGRQLYVALSLYQEQADAQPCYPSFDQMIDTGVLPDPSLAVVKGDPFPRGQYGEYWACFETTVPFKYRLLGTAFTMIAFLITISKSWSD